MPPFVVRFGLVLAAAWLLHDLVRRSPSARGEAPQTGGARPALRPAGSRAGHSPDPPRVPASAGVDPLVEKHRAAQFDKDWRTVDYSRLSPERPDRTSAADPRSTWAPPPAPPVTPDAPYAAHFSSFGVSTVHADVSWPDGSTGEASGTDPTIDPPSAEEGADDLTRISGIGPSIERLLFQNGVFRFAQIAGWSDADAARMEALVGFSGRVTRERWREQARALDAARS